jgi:hypothetical protein
MPVGLRSKTKHLPYAMTAATTPSGDYIVRTARNRLVLGNALPGLVRRCQLALCSEFRGRPLLFRPGDKLRIDIEMPTCELQLFLPNHKSALLDGDLVTSRS